MNKYYFTFGGNHRTREGFSLGQSYVVITAAFEEEARHLMHKARGDVWAFSYTEEEFKGQPEEYGLTELTLDQVKLN